MWRVPNSHAKSNPLDEKAPTKGCFQVFYILPSLLVSFDVPLKELYPSSRAGQVLHPVLCECPHALQEWVGGWVAILLP